MIGYGLSEVELDDAAVLEIHRAPGVVRIRFSGGVLHAADAARSDDARNVRNVCVTLREVRRERAEYFIGAGVTAPHPAPQFPLDRVATADVRDGVLLLQGYRGTEPWYTWEIDFGALTVEWADPAPSDSTIDRSQD